MRKPHWNHVGGLGMDLKKCWTCKQRIVKIGDFCGGMCFGHFLRVQK